MGQSKSKNTNHGIIVVVFYLDCLYDATGAKLQKTVGSSVTDYAGNHVYQNGNLQFFNHAEGYATPDGGSGYDYIYQYKDHLGNIRLSYVDNNGTTEIVEENNYYPFGLKHKGYNEGVSPLGNSVANQWKYNGVEFEEGLGLDLYEMDLRQYDAALGRFTGIDPVIHYSMSTYTAFDNNPAYWSDPSGADSYVYFNGKTHLISSNQLTNVYSSDDSTKGESSDNSSASSGEGSGSDKQNPQDDIIVNSEGIVVDVKENKEPNRFFDEQGNELKFHDSDNVDGQYMSGTWLVGDRVFIPVSTEQMNKKIGEAGPIWQRWSSGININGNPGAGIGYWFWSLAVARQKGHGDFDFAENYLAKLIDNPSLNMEQNRSLTSYNDGAGFFRFGNSNNIYNLYDAGNYMWGRAMAISGFKYGEARLGSQVNERFGDSQADQRAIKNGFYGN